MTSVVTLALPPHRIHAGATVSVGAPGTTGTRRFTLPDDVAPGSTVVLAGPDDEPDLEVVITLKG